jgi:hypothetical protein
MRLSEITFGEFDRVLRSLGFQRTLTDRGSRFYQHDASETWVSLPQADDDDFVPVAHIVGNGRILDERGIVARHDFERMLRSQKVA